MTFRLLEVSKWTSTIQQDLRIDGTVLGLAFQFFFAEWPWLSVEDWGEGLLYSIWGTCGTLRSSSCWQRSQVWHSGVWVKDTDRNYPSVGDSRNQGVTEIDLQASRAECQFHVSLTTHPVLIYKNSGLFLKPSLFMVFSALDHTLPLWMGGRDKRNKTADALVWGLFVLLPFVLQINF